MAVGVSFLGQLAALFGGEPRAIVAVAKRPQLRHGQLYDVIAAPDSTVAIAPFFECRAQRPSVFHHGNRGLTRDCILADHALFLAVQKEIDCPTQLAQDGTVTRIQGANPYRA